jgi:hypothetical protein
MSIQAWIPPILGSFKHQVLELNVVDTRIQDSIRSAQGEWYIQAFFRSVDIAIPQDLPVQLAHHQQLCYVHAHVGPLSFPLEI